MKLTTLLLITAILQVSASTFAQKVTLSEKNAPLLKVFDDISNQTGYDFLVSTSTLKSANPVTIEVKNVEVQDVLRQIFNAEPLKYQLQNKSVVVSQKEPNFLDKAKSWYSQVAIRGKVTNELGDPMAGATVKEKGTQNATVTDAKGIYSITVTDEKSIIDFSYIGYEPQELPAKDIPNGSVIILKPQPQNLQEVVISKGYYDEKRALSTGDVGVVTAKEIEEQPVTDPIQTLIGRVSGLNIQQTSGIPGAYAAIIIRGPNSIANGNDPYYVIDGVPFISGSLSYLNGALGGGSGGYNSGGPTQYGHGLSPFNVLNPDDIENIEILKDADATAIYGSKGANGVILITTKKGKAGETKVSFDLSEGISQVGHFMDLLNTQQYLQMFHQAFTNDGLPFPSIKTNPNDYYYDVDGLWDTTRYTNWQKTLIGGTAQYTNAQGSLSGGTANTQYFIGGGYTRQTTVFPGDYDDTKGSLHFNLSQTSANQKFRVVFSGSYGAENNVIPTADFTGSVFFLPPDAPALYNSDGTLNWQIYNGNSTFNNPLGPTLESATSNAENLGSNLDLSYQLAQGLVLESDFGYNNYELGEEELFPATANDPPYNTDPSTRENILSNSSSQGWIIEPKLSYRKKIAKGELNLLLGGTLQETKQQLQSILSYDFANDGLIGDPDAAVYKYLNGYGSSETRYDALLARVGYTWEDKYILNMTANRDGSSKFGPGRQYGNFGSMGAGWIFSKEKLVTNNLPWLSFGKLRGSYGITGSDQTGSYQYLSTYKASSTSYQGTATLSPNGLSNPNLAWEVDKKLEGDIDLGFLKDRINLSVAWYRNRSGNQLFNEPLASITGFSGVEYNLPAVVQNTGLEINLNTVNVKTGDFSWNTSFNFSSPRNKLVSYPGLAASGFQNQYVVGQSLYIKKLYDYSGVNSQTGLYTFAQEDASGNIPYPQGLVTTAPVTQKFYGGIGNNFSYKGFQLSIFLQFVKQLGYNATYLNNDAPGSDQVNQLVSSVLGAWTTPGQVAAIEKLSTEYPSAYSNYLNSTGILADDSFIKLRNVAMSYQLPTSWQKWARMSNARIYLQGQNLYTWTKYQGLDPESDGGGLGLPPLRTIVLGLSASF